MLPFTYREGLTILLHPMLLPLRYFVGRFLATLALLGYLAAAAEQVVPDCHDWNDGNAAVSSLVAGGHASDRPEHAPVHPVHVCHEDHQHGLVLGDIAPVLRAVARAASVPDLTPNAPSLPPLRLSLRPPIV